MAELPLAPDPSLHPYPPHPSASCPHTPPTQPPQGQEKPVAGVGWWALAPCLAPSLPLTWALGEALGALIPQLPGPELHGVAGPEQWGAVGLVQLCRERASSWGTSQDGPFRLQPQAAGWVCPPCPYPASFWPSKLLQGPQTSAGKRDPCGCRRCLDWARGWRAGPAGMGDA